MREIKFRAWDERLKIMYLEYFCFTKSGFPNCPYSLVSHNLIPLQYTGLKDKNGVEIYEGDIVEVFESCEDDDGKPYKNNETRHQVEYGIKWDYPAFDLVPHISEEMNSLSYLFSTNEYQIEVIGNIYENKELFNV